MTVIRAKTLGYCMGVRRAMDSADTALENSASNGKKVFSLGPLIHNKTALDNLSGRGLSVLKETEIDLLTEKKSASGEINSQECGASAVGKFSASGGCSSNASVIIIRAHGVPPKTQCKLENAGIEIVDATCPLVKRSQKIAAEYSQKGWTVILSGDKNHGEVIGIAGYAGENFVLVQNEAEANALVAESAECGDENAVLLAQTTYSEKEFEKIENVLKNKFVNLKVINTICPATQERQNALLELAPKVDGILVIGGKNSANTSRLLASAKKLVKHAALIENADEIPEEFFSLEKVGLTAGASTPDSVIDAVEQKLTN